MTILLGHRGVGKSSFLKRISRYLPGAACYDLDSEIEKSHGSIKTIFAEQGEDAFRQIENKVFEQLLEKSAKLATPIYIAVGGGFKGNLPQGVNVVWLQRDWDVSENIFFDRPSINPDAKDLRIPPEVFRARGEFWEESGYDVLTLPEGVYHSHSGEAAYFLGEPVGGAITLMPQHFQGQRIQYIKNLRTKFVELRDDLLSLEQMTQALTVFKPQQILLSFRNPESENQTAELVSCAAYVDWPVERGEPPFNLPAIKRIRSLHSEEDNFFDALEMVEGLGQSSVHPIKWSPSVKNFLQLRLGHEWQKRNPANRLFLPRSENGRWYWYRHLQKQNLMLNFFRIDFGSSLDQPTLLQWLQPTSSHFAAVLGQPVLQSWSPGYHAEFFAKKNASLYSIEVDEQDLRDGGFEFLCELGLFAAAVTSPLKSWAGQLAGKKVPLNTLTKNQSSWEGANTDEIGFQFLLDQNHIELESLRVAIWGGGGVLPSLKLPKAVVYSARTGFPREGEPLLKEIDALVWAAGSQITDTLPREWRPKFVIDLNYRADSPGRMYAFSVGAKYISGEDMFFKQADEQQKIWSSL